MSHSASAGDENRLNLKIVLVVIGKTHSKSQSSLGVSVCGATATENPKKKCVTLSKKNKSRLTELISRIYSLI